MSYFVSDALTNKLKKIINDDEIYNKASEMASKPKVRPSTIQGKNNYIYNLPHVELHTGLDLINKALKKPKNNNILFYNNKGDSEVIKKLNSLLEEDTENNLILSLIIFQKQKERNINFVPRND